MEGGCVEVSPFHLHTTQHPKPITITLTLNHNSRQVYYVYGFMLLVFAIMVVVTACVAVVGTYFLLNAENYHWQWTSFSMAASTAGYVALYAAHYYLFKTRMSGLLQTAFYFGYTAMACLALGLMTGAVGYWAAGAFVRTIYRQVKCD